MSGMHVLSLSCPSRWSGRERSVPVTYDKNPLRAFREAAGRGGGKKAPAAAVMSLLKTH